MVLANLKIIKVKSEGAIVYNLASLNLEFIEKLTEVILSYKLGYTNLIFSLTGPTDPNFLKIKRSQKKLDLFF